ncbi:MAG TPA: O-antigen ligase family protein [Acidimicrobiales bacterium]|nr:O-antigen ligase family protein [Acidimicrobiales bacterium]
MLAALVAVPLVILPPAADIFGLPKLVVVAVAAAVGWLASPGRLRSIRMGALEWAVVAYVGVVAISSLFSRSVLDSVFGSHQRYGGLLPLLVYLWFAALVVVAFRGRPDRLDLVPVAVVGSAAVVAAYVLLQTAGVDVYEWEQAAGGTTRYAAGFMGNPDFAGGLLGMALPFGVRAALMRNRWLFGAATLVVAAGLVATRSRGGLLAGAVGLLVLGIVERDRVPRRVWVGAGALTGVALALVALRPSFVERTELLRTESVEARGRQWAGAWQVFLDSPVIGTGPDTFEFAFPAHRSGEDGRTLGMQIADKPHNVLLEKATDTGVLGFAAYAAVIVLAFRRARREAAVFVAGLAAYLAQAFVSIDVPPLALLGWVMIAGIVAASAPAAKATRKQAPMVARTVAAAAVVVLGAVALRADLAAGSGDWETAASWHPGQPTYRFGAAFADERGRRFDEAMRHYDDVLAWQPHSVHALAGRARALGQAGEYPAADGSWRRAAELDPHNWEVHNGHALLLNAWSNATRGDRDLRGRAVAKLELTLAIKPDHVPAWINLAKLRAALGDPDGTRRAAEEARRLDPANAEAASLLARLP